MAKSKFKVENVDTNIKDDSQLTIDNWPNSKRIGMKNGISGIAYAECVKCRRANGTNGTNGANGASQAHY